MSEHELKKTRRIRRDGLAGEIKRRFPRMRRRTPPGSAPGMVVADPAANRPTITLTSYSGNSFTEIKIDSPAEIGAHLNKDEVLWIDVDGLGDSEVVKAIGEIFSLHPLALEDVVNVHQRPKVDEYVQYLFLVARMPTTGKFFGTEQLSMFLGKHTLITFQEIQGGDCFDILRDRLRKGKGKIREKGADYLAYAILDAVIDYYFPVLEEYGDRLEEFESAAIAAISSDVMAQVHEAKQELLVIRRAVWPMREAINMMIRDSGSLLSDETRLHLRDCYDHTIQIIDLVETYREICADIRDIYLSSVSNRMNEIMKVLTIIATIFIPLTFVVGVYGMNFDPDTSPLNMPELRWKYGYPFCWLIMLAIASGLLIYFRRRKWI